MDDIINEKENKIKENEYENEILKLTIKALKNREIHIVLTERRKLYCNLSKKIPKVIGFKTEQHKRYIIRHNEMKMEYNKILEKFDNDFNITEVDLKVDSFQEYRFELLLDKYTTN